MTFKYNNVYVIDTSCVCGPYEKKGPISSYFDKAYSDFYCGKKSWEKAEIKLLNDSIDILLDKTKKEYKNIDLIISGDLLNQITASCYALKKYNIPFLGIYSACSTISEGMIIAASMIDSKKINNSIICTSSHNMSSEKQYRNPTEYGAPKKKSSTFTSTGAASMLLSSNKSNIKVTASTIGKIIDMNQNDPFNMGAAMACGAADTIYRHLKDLKRKPEYYDLILTGDLGKYGKQILIDYMKDEYKMDLGNNYNDCGVMLYDLEKQKNINAGGSGPVCSALVCFGYIIDMMKKKKIKRVLLACTGALFSPTLLNQHENIYSISHVVSLEVVE